MKTMTLRARATLLAPALALSLLAACDTSAVAPTAAPTSAAPFATVSLANDNGAIRHVDEFRSDFTDRIIILGCEDGTLNEIVRLSGGVIEKWTYMQLPTGTVIGRHEVRPDGLTGVGLESGDEYDVLHRVNWRDIYADKGIKGVHRETWEVKNRRTGQVFGLTYVLGYQMDADRNLIVHREQEHVTCR